MCVFLPCGKDIYWAVPQSCLAEIISLPAGAGSVPEEVAWRGESVPVLDMASGGQSWCDGSSGTGLVAIFLGVRGENCAHWGVALRGDGLGVCQLAEDQCRDLPEARGEYALAAFEMEGRVYQVPDLPALQRSARKMEAAVSG